MKFLVIIINLSKGEVMRVIIIPIIAIVLNLSNSKAQSNILSGNVRSLGMQPRSGLQVKLRIISPLNRSKDGVFISNDAITATTDTNGNYYYTNVAFGRYTETLSDSSGTYRLPIVTTNTVGYWQIASLVTNSASAIPPRWSFDSVTTTFDSQ